MDLFELCAHISLDSSEYEQGISKAEKKGSKFGENLKKVLSQAGKISAAAVSAAATGVGTIIKNSIEEYANYEQLVGGIETLFGNAGKSMQEYIAEQSKLIEESGFVPDLEFLETRWKAFDAVEQKVLSNASNAFKTAGLSANEYMETITGFTAALKQSIDSTDAVADYADMAVTDMSDNANKMGTDMALLQSAYQGFAKQNYTMLDNLKLGYGGTATEMARLVNESGVLGDAMIDLGDQQNIGAALAEVGFAKMVEAIHVVQTEMGITGTTAKEASTTISGSVASMKAAWENLLVGVANEEADFEQLIHDFVDTVGVTAENIIPRIDTALNGAAQLIDRVVPIIVEKIPELVSDRLPQMLESGVKIIQSITTGMLNSIDDISDMALETVDVLVDGIIDALPDIIVAGTMLIFKLADGLIKAIPDLVARIPEIVKAIWDGFASHWPDFVDVGKSIVNGIIDGLSRAWNTLTSWIGAQPLNIAGETVWVNGSHAGGLDYVPYDGYVAKLDRGEMVLTKDEALATRNGAVGAAVSVVQNIYSKAQTAADLMEEARYQQEKAVYLGA